MSCAIIFFNFFLNRKWCMYMCVCVCVCVYNIGKSVLKLQFSDNKDIGLTFKLQFQRQYQLQFHVEMVF